MHQHHLLALIKNFKKLYEVILNYIKDYIILQKTLRIILKLSGEELY